MKLNEQLTIEQRKEILSYFNIVFYYNLPLDSDYGYEIENAEGFDLNTLKGILDYAKAIGKQEGVEETQENIKKVLGI